MEKYCYSYNEERFEGDCESREEALTEALDVYPENDFVWTGIAKKVTVFDIIGKPDRYIDELEGNLYDIIGTFDEISSPFENVTDKQLKSLKETLCSAVESWMEENNIHLDIFTVVDLKEHPRNISDDCNK